MQPAIAIQSAASRLADTGIGPDQVFVAGPRLREAIALWNMDVDRMPAVVVLCATPRDVQGAVRVARACGLPLSVLGGGHDWAGRAIRDSGLVINLSLMRSVEVTGDVAVVGGGATNLDLITAAERAGLTAVAGGVGAVGFAGLATGGGYGPLLGRFGLAADNLLSAEVVLANGDVVTASEGEHPDLFWALRGGGGNFGVITSLRVRLQPMVPFRSGIVAFPFVQARNVLHGYSELIANSPDDLTADAGVMSGPDGTPMVFVAPTWSGGAAAGANILERIAALGTPVMKTVTDTTFSAMMRGNDELFSARGNWALGTRNLSDLTPATVDAIVDIAQTRTSPQSVIYWHHFHGAASRISLADAAFGERRNHLMIELIARWSDGEDASAHRGWVRDATEALAPHALPGGYPNLLGSDAHDQIAHAYGPNAPRLLAAKARYDPDGVFTAIPLPSQSGQPGTVRCTQDPGSATPEREGGDRLSVIQARGVRT